MKSERVYLRLSVEQKARWVAAAEERSLTLQGLIEACVEDHCVAIELVRLASQFPRPVMQEIGGKDIDPMDPPKRKTLRSRVADRFLSRSFIYTNDLGAKSIYRVGEVVDGWRVTRHQHIPTAPWGTIAVYGRRVK